LYKDSDGSFQLMQQALQRTRPEDKGDRAWLLTHIGRLLVKKKAYANAEVALDAALKAYPDYHYALASLARCGASRRTLATYYVQHAKKPAAGLRIAKAEVGRRRDVHTLEVYAKALRASGKAAEPAKWTRRSRSG
jgi:tetratricopeptide (TPR) repeat protein